LKNNKTVKVVQLKDNFAMIESTTQSVMQMSVGNTSGECTCGKKSKEALRKRCCLANETSYKCDAGVNVCMCANVTLQITHRILRKYDGK